MSQRPQVCHISSKLQSIGITCESARVSLPKSPQTVLICLIFPCLDKFQIRQREDGKDPLRQF